MPEINELYYLKKALQLATDDRAKILKGIDEYLPVGVDGRPTREEHLKALKMYNDGYSLLDENLKLVQVERAMGDLNGMIYFKEEKYKRCHSEGQ